MHQIFLMQVESSVILTDWNPAVWFSSDVLEKNAQWQRIGVEFSLPKEESFFRLATDFDVSF